MRLTTVKCTYCGKTLCESAGEVKKKCPACGKYTHVVVTSKGIINLDILEQKQNKDKTW
jgi:phage FluMu protein Com